MTFFTVLKRLIPLPWTRQPLPAALELVPLLLSSDAGRWQQAFLKLTVTRHRERVHSHVHKHSGETHTIRGTDLPFHVRSDGDGRPDG